MKLTRDRLNELLLYDPVSGNFTWKVSRKGLNKGDKAGCINKKGYVVIRVDRVAYLAHRLVFLMETGSFPSLQVDHVDRDKSNNRRSNLREVTSFNNQANRGINRNNTSGIKGVSWSKAANKWQANFNSNGKKIYLGLFEDFAEAANRIKLEREKHQGEYACHN